MRTPPDAGHSMNHAVASLRAVARPGGLAPPTVAAPSIFASMLTNWVEMYL